MLWAQGAVLSGTVEFSKVTFSRTAWFDGVMFSRDHRPVWPDGFTEPAGIVWVPVDPPPTGPDPDLSPAPPPTP